MQFVALERAPFLLLMEELVTCLCLTRNRREWLPRAIECFQQQTYQNRELLVVWDGESISDLIPPDETIRLIHAPEGRYTIGEKRNYGCAHANGSIIAHFDDDDYSSPERLTDQITRMLEADKAVSAYCSVIFEGPDGRWQYRGVPNCTAVGTSLVYKKSWWAEHQFSTKHVGEDSDFAFVAAQNRQLVSVDGEEKIVASIHASNTSPRHVEGAQWRRL